MLESVVGVLIAIIIMLVIRIVQMCRHIRDLQSEIQTNTIIIDRVTNDYDELEQTNEMLEHQYSTTRECIVSLQKIIESSSLIISENEKTILNLMNQQQMTKYQ